MRILITNIFLSCPHGSENFSLTLADELKNQGHEVDYFAMAKGWFAGYLESKGYFIYNTEIPTSESYDLALANHGTALSELIKPLLIDKIIFISHGRIAEETPPVWDKGKFGYLAMTSEIQDYWQPTIQKKIRVINNPIADDYYWAEPLKNKELHRILWGNHRFAIPAELSEYCALKGIELSGSFYNELPEHILEETFKTQLVIGTGRWIYQAMAAGRSCLIADDKRIAGYLTPKNYFEFIKTNMTTRIPSAKEIEPGDWERFLNEYDYSTGERLREISFENHHVEKVVNDILEFANAL